MCYATTWALGPSGHALHVQGSGSGQATIHSSFQWGRNEVNLQKALISPWDCLGKGREQLPGHEQ